jgi:hypothetical protein
LFFSVRTGLIGKVEILFEHHCPTEVWSGSPTRRSASSTRLSPPIPCDGELTPFRDARPEYVKVRYLPHELIELVREAKRLLLSMWLADHGRQAFQSFNFRV